MLIARSAPECHLYMELHPCSCGEPAFDVRHHLEQDDAGELVAVYQGPCRRCGLPRRFLFTLDPDLPPAPPAYGGSQPSVIICPGQFALRADEASRSVRADGGDGDGSAALARQALAEAVAAQAEILKFIPDGADRVPLSAFRSPEGLVLHEVEPGRFRRARLEAVLESYRDALSRQAGS